jgi:hypothetical protein
MADRAWAEPRREKLLPGHDSVLPPSQIGCPSVSCRDFEFHNNPKSRHRGVRPPLARVAAA